MALINCPECGREVSDQADACPRCAYPIAKKNVTPVPGAPAAEEAAAAQAGDEAAPEAAGTSGAEHTIWEGTPSQLTNFKPVAGLLFMILFIIGLVVSLDYIFKHEYREVYYGLAIIVVPLIVILWKWLQVSCHRYEVTNERIRVRTGILARSHEVVELYRVKDISLERPFLMRLFGLGDVIAITSDKSTPTVTFHAVRGATGFYEELRKHVEQRRVQRRVREVDFE